MAAILAALCLNYKHFGGGLPDLLLMRAVRTDSGAVAREEDEDAVSAKGVETARGVATSAAASIAVEEEEKLEAEVSTVRCVMIVDIFDEGRGLVVGGRIADLLDSPESRAASSTFSRGHVVERWHHRDVSFV